MSFLGTSEVGKKQLKERKKNITLASYTCNRHHGWRTQTSLLFLVTCERFVGTKIACQNLRGIWFLKPFIFDSNIIIYCVALANHYIQHPFHL